MTAAGELQHGAAVPLEAGLWAVALVVLLALVLLTVLRPALRGRRKETPVACCTPGSLGAHPLIGQPGPDGARSCACGAVRSFAQLAEVRPLSLVPRTDTREHRWPTAEQPLMPATSLGLAKATGHPTVWQPAEEPETDERPLPHIVWPPR